MVKKAAQEILNTAGWGPEKVAIFKQAFFDFLTHVTINSKEKGGDYYLADAVYNAQHRFLDNVFSGLSEDAHDFKVLKSRQLGISTISRALVVFWIGMFKGIQGAMVFDTQPHMQEAKIEVESMIRGLPPSLKFPRIVSLNRDLMKLSNGATIRFLQAGVRSSKGSGTLGRSSGLNLCHCSEVCSWQNDEGIVSFKQALAEEFPDRLYIWESTARGYNAWADIWDEAKADTLNQRTIFLGWWSKDTQKINRGTPAFEKYGKAAPTSEERKKIAEVKAMYGHEVTQEQLAWFRRKTDPLAQKESDSVDDQYLKAEQAWTEIDSFQLSGSTFFDAEKLTELARDAGSIKFKSFWYFFGSNFVECDIHPARTHKETKLRVWEEPLNDSVYVVAADPAYGHDEHNDRSAVQVFRCFADQIEQVAEYACATTSPEQLSWVMASLAGAYSAPANSQVHLIFEINGPGEAVLVAWKNLRLIVANGYLQKAAREKGLLDVFNNVRQYIYTRSDSTTAGAAMQWRTTTQLKVAIMERLRDGVKNDTVIIRSRDTLEEMKSVARDGDSIKAEGKKKDDRVMTAAMAMRAWEEKVRRGLVTTNRTKEADQAKRSMSIQDQFQLFSRNTMQGFFAKKRAGRILAARAALKDRHRPMGTRRR